MTIKFMTRDITTVESGIVAHGVNCQGKMNSGVAKAIRAKWPKAFEHYDVICKFHKKNRASMLGMVNLVDVGEEPGHLYVANCFTQEFYGKDGRVYADLHAIKECFMALYEVAVGQNNLLFLPRIGCGLGGLSWDTQVGVVLNDIDTHFDYCNIGNPDVFICDV